MNPSENAIEASVSVSDRHAKVRKAQNLAFGAFILFCAIDIVFRILKATNVLPPSNSAYYVAMGCVSLVGYIILYTISSNLSSDFFAAGQLMLELFFPVAVPVVLYLGTDNAEDYLAIYYLSMLICAASLYNWSMLLNNNKFSRRQRAWIMILPMISVFNFIQYWNFLGRMEGRDQLLHVNFYDNLWCLLVMVLLVMAMTMGYWVLTHSRAFSGNKNEFDMPRFSPLNPYLLFYASISAVGMLIF